MKEINGQEMLNLLEKAVAERGDSYVYPDQQNCVYVYRPDEEFNPNWDDGKELDTPPAIVTAFSEEQPACGVGLALSYLDWRLLNDLSEIDNRNAFNDLAAKFNEHGEYHFTDAAIYVGLAFQKSQDMGYDWGHSLVIAKNELTQVEETK